MHAARSHTAQPAIEEMVEGPKAARFNSGDRKLAELVLYVAKLSEDDPNFGATKLNRVLAQIDFGYFREHGVPVTGQEYQHLNRGPAPRRLKPVREGLEEQKALKIAFTLLDPIEKVALMRPVALREPDLTLFSPEELAFARDVVDRWAPYTGQEMSVPSHLTLGWKLTKMGETIPYEVALAEPATSGHDPDFGGSLSTEADSALAGAHS